jgi:pyridoxal phosphate enzyme (YggS family)
MSLASVPPAVAQISARIAAAEQAAGRPAGSVTLLAVGKGQPAAALRAAAAAGLTHFGESYLQEALPKMEALSDLALTWHFIGHLQANKTRSVAQAFAWVHGVDRLKIAARLSEQRPYHAPPLNLCLEVNLAGEPGKSGVAPAELPALATAVAQLPRLTLKGLMCLPPQQGEPRHWFRMLAALRTQLAQSLPGLDTLSMGMSGDFEAAILEGATLVRIGTALFGPRPAAGAGR